MNYTGTIYRPPMEAQSLLLQVTTGCSHNKCAFCYMYHDIPFAVSPMEEVLADIDEAARLWPGVERVFLENGDAFCLSAERLKQIAEAIHAKLPKVNTIAMYASIQNIKGKTDEELRMLHDLGIDDLNIGVESGLDAALERLNKGHTSEEAIYELGRLKKAGIEYCLNIILGGAGADLIHENAEASARLINAVQPPILFMGTLHTDPGCSLHQDMKSGAFPECTFGQLLDEQEELISLLELDNTYYFGLHPSNIIPIQGMLPRDKDAMIQAIHEMRSHLKGQLEKYPVRGSEGSILL
jgi:histone acetyltransferase (RNA polymerase elongator complex component)